MKSIHNEWGSGDKYSRDIFYSFKSKANNPMLYKTRRFFALTKQPDNFQILRTEDLLGLIQITKNTTENFNKIEYLQTSPDYQPQIYLRKFKGVGAALLATIEKILPKADTILYALPTNREFYERQGYIWQNPLGKMIKKVLA